MENQTQLNEESQSITLDYYLLHRHSRPYFFRGGEDSELFYKYKVNFSL